MGTKVRKKKLQRRDVPSQEYLDILATMNRVDEFPSAELVDRFLCYDPVMAFVADRIMDWMLWRMKQGRVFKRLASSDVFSVELQAAHDVAMARMYARWKKQPDAKGEGDGIRMAHDGTWGRGRG